LAEIFNWGRKTLLNQSISQKYSKDCGIEFACVSFHVGLPFINFSSFKLDTENTTNFDAVSSKHGNFDAVS